MAQISSIDGNVHVKVKNAPQTNLERQQRRRVQNRERQQRYREQNREKLRQLEAERRKRKHNGEITTELSTPPNVECTGIIDYPSVDEINTNFRSVAGLEGMHRGAVEVSQQDERGKEIQRRWKNIKDTYVKSLKPDARTYGHLKRPYVFHKKLSFLQPHLESKLKRADVSPEHENSGFNSNSSQVQTTTLSQKSISSSLMSKFKNLPSKKSKNVKTINSFEKKLWDIFKTDLESKRSGLPDPDEQFVRSQIPLLKKLRPSDKLDFQIKWLELVKSYAICEDSNSE